MRMAGEKPTLPNGFIGAQPRFSEFKMKTESHKSSQIRVEGRNIEKIKLGTGQAMKVGLNNCFLYLFFLQSYSRVSVN